MESTRQAKVARQIQRDLSEILTQDMAGSFSGVMVTVTAVRMSPDLSFAKVFLSIFPYEKHAAVMEIVNKNSWLIRKTLGLRVKHQLRIVPELAFEVDDSLEYIDNIESLLNK